MSTVSLDRFAPPDGSDEAVVIAECACGCGGEILAGYEHYEVDGEWFYDEDCVLKHIGAERRAAG